jgi:transposase
MAHFHVKTKKGRPYLYVREIARVGGRPKVVSQTYLGSPERVRQLASGEPSEAIRLRVEEFGALWIANEMDRGIDLASLVDAVVPRGKRETGPTVGEYFLYCVFNRMVESRSKNRMAEWYERTAIQHIRPVEIKELTSERYWEKWDRVSEKSLETIGREFFRRVWSQESVKADCLLFDTTNTYTFMASDTQSDLAMRGKNKAGRHHLRQIGLGLLVDRNSRLPLYYRTYPGNLHDSKLFHSVMDEMFGVVCGLNDTKQRLTVVIDKGMNAEDNYSWVDEHSRVHFVTTYSPYFADALARTPLERFEPLVIEKNRRLIADGKVAERLLAHRTKGEFWGKERTVVVTHNPRTERKKNYTLDAKLETVRQELLKMRKKVNNSERQWRNRDAVIERYHRLCGRLHLPSELFAISFSSSKDGLQMSFKKDIYEVNKTRASFGRNIIITDNTDWATSDIVQTSLDRWEVEDAFRLSNDDELVSIRPVRHWTDSKIRCHLFSCVVALTYLRRLEIRLDQRGVKRTAASVMEDMRHLHSVLSLANGRRSKPRRTVEVPSKTQREVLLALGHHVDQKGVLRPRAP